MSPTTRIVLFNFWEYVAFLTNSLVFLLIGLQVNIPSADRSLAADPVGDWGRPGGPFPGRVWADLAGQPVLRARSRCAGSMS